MCRRIIAACWPCYVYTAVACELLLLVPTQLALGVVWIMGYVGWSGMGIVVEELETSKQGGDSGIGNWYPTDSIPVGEVGLIWEMRTEVQRFQTDSLCCIHYLLEGFPRPR